MTADSHRDGEARDREEIRELKARYIRHVDTKQWDALRGLFAPQARFEGFRLPYAGGDAFVDAISNRLRDAQSDHHCGSHEIQFLSPDVARAVWSMTDRVEFTAPIPVDADPESAAPTGAYGWSGAGFYLDEYRRLDGAWLFSALGLVRLRLDPTHHPSGALATPAAASGTALTQWLDGPARATAGT